MFDQARTWGVQIWTLGIFFCCSVLIFKESASLNLKFISCLVLLDNKLGR